MCLGTKFQTPPPRCPWLYLLDLFLVSSKYIGTVGIDQNIYFLVLFKRFQKTTTVNFSSNNNLDPFWLENDAPTISLTILNNFCTSIEQTSTYLHKKLKKLWDLAFCTIVRNYLRIASHDIIHVLEWLLFYLCTSASHWLFKTWTCFWCWI